VHEILYYIKNYPAKGGAFNSVLVEILVQPECSLVANYTCRRGYGISPAGLTGLIGSNYWFVYLIYKKEKVNSEKLIYYF
jgi:hypothetical protein